MEMENEAINKNKKKQNLKKNHILSITFIFKKIKIKGKTTLLVFEIYCVSAIDLLIIFFFFESPTKLHSFIKEESNNKASQAGGGDSSNHTTSPSNTLA